MTVRAIDSNNDWIFGSGSNSYNREGEAVNQNIITRLQEWVGDCFFNINAGIDYLNLLDRNTKELLVVNIRSVILRTRNVTSLEDISVNLVGRQLRISYRARTSFSAIINNEIVI